MKHNNSIVLIGMPGCGKSTIGKALSEIMQVNFYDTDILIERKEKKTIPEIFSGSGESYFRKLETQVLTELNDGIPKVVSTGGGIVTITQNHCLLKKIGMVFYIERDVENIFKSIENTDRPLVQNGLRSLKDLYEKRKELYEKASDYVVQNDTTPEKTAEKIYIIIKGISS